MERARLSIRLGLSLPVRTCQKLSAKTALVEKHYLLGGQQALKEVVMAVSPSTFGRRYSLWARNRAKFLYLNGLSSR